MSQHPLIAEYAENLRRITHQHQDESDIIEKVSPLAQSLSLNHDWIEDRFMHPDETTGFSVFLLHEEEDHRLAVLAVSWVPGMGIEPHDHGTWAVVACVKGLEKNISYKRLDDRSNPKYAELEIKSESITGPGDLVCMKTGGIHEVRNDGDEVALSIHTYGYHINHTGRSQFNLETNQVNDFIVSVN